MNTFRHWFMWSAIEVAPGKYDWRDYDRMMDLAAQNGIKVVIAELITAAPEWMFHKYPQARYLASDGTVENSTIGGSSATGGFPGLCLDNPEVKAAAEKFLVALGRALPRTSRSARVRLVERKHVWRRQSKKDVLLLRLDEAEAEGLGSQPLWIARESRQGLASIQLCDLGRCRTALQF